MLLYKVNKNLKQLRSKLCTIILTGSYVTLIHFKATTLQPVVTNLRWRFFIIIYIVIGFSHSNSYDSL